MESGRIVDFNAELRDLHPDTAQRIPFGRLEKTWVSGRAPLARSLVA